MHLEEDTEQLYKVSSQMQQLFPHSPVEHVKRYQTTMTLLVSFLRTCIEGTAAQGECTQNLLQGTVLVTVHTILSKSPSSQHPLNLTAH